MVHGVTAQSIRQRTAALTWVAARCPVLRTWLAAAGGLEFSVRMRIVSGFRRLLLRPRCHFSIGSVKMEALSRQVALDCV